MNDKHYSILSLILALAALVISTLIFSFYLIDMLGVISGNTLNNIWLESLRLFFWGWIPGLALSIIAFLRSRRLKNKLLKLVIWLILSVSAISALLWATFAIGFTYGYRYN